MTKFFSRLFSGKFVNHSAVADNVALLLMYRFAYPFSVFLSRLHLTPNQITTLSLIFSIAAFLSIIVDDGILMFSTFWGISLLLDFCDGTVARMTNSGRKNAFRYDHISDLFKISLIILGASLRYDDRLVWISSFSASFCFMFFSVLNQELVTSIKFLERQSPLIPHSEESSTAHPRLRNRYRLIAWAVKNNAMLTAYKNVRTGFLTINGHTLLLFFLLPLNREWSIGALSYLSIVSVIGIRSRIAMLLSLRKW